VQKRKWYPADDVKTPIKSRKSKKQQTKLKKNITPGSVLILLAGRNKGKRCVFLKQLDSGLLLVTGPFKVNGVPLRRVNQAYTIATTTKALDVSKIDVSKITDKNFGQNRKQASAAKEFLQKNPNAKYEVPASKKDLQQQVDAALIPQLTAGGKRNLIGQYLNTPFSLQKGQAPHQLKF